jgi:phosphotransferase system enzyme I (PtsI)
MARTVLVGRAGSPGVGVGRLLVVAPPSTAAAAGVAGAGRAAAGNSRGLSTRAAEHRRLAEALDRCATQLEALAVQTTARAGVEVGAIFDAQALFARDPGIVSPAIALVAAGSSAEEAILRATSEQADVLAAVDDEYFRERAADVRDVGRRVAAILTRQRLPRCGRSSWPGSRSPVVRRRGMPRSWHARSGSLSCSASVRR